MDPRSEHVEAWPIFDNPGVGRALRDMLPPRRFGRFLFFHALGLAIGLGAATWLHQASGSMELSLPRIQLAVVLGLELLVAGCAPLWFLTMTQNERKAGCLDEFCVTGTSPLALFGGRFLVALAMMLLLHLEAVPAVAVIVTCGGGTVLEAVSLLGMTFAFTLFALTAGLAMATAVEDQGVVVVVVSLAGALFLGLLPELPASVASASPSRSLLHLFAPDIERLAGVDVGAPVLYGTEVAPWLVSTLWSIALAIPCIGVFLVGPDITFRPGFSDFHGMAPIGWEDDRIRRAPLRKVIHKALQFRFFYENLGERHRRWIPMMRPSFRLVGLGALALLAFGAIPVDPGGGAEEGRDLLSAALAVAAVLTLFAALVAGRARDALLDHRAGIPGTPIPRIAVEATSWVLGLLLPVAVFGGALLAGGWGVDPPTARVVEGFTVVGSAGLVVLLVCALLSFVFPTGLEAMIWGGLGCFFAAVIPAFPVIVETSLQRPVGDLIGLMDLTPFLAAEASIRPDEPIRWAIRTSGGGVLERTHDPSTGPFLTLAAVLVPLLLAGTVLLARRALDAPTRPVAGTGEEDSP